MAKKDWGKRKTATESKIVTKKGGVNRQTLAAKT